MKIKTRKYGLIHYYAQCDNCDWNCGIRTEIASFPQDVRNEVYKHIRKTGHKVSVEGGTHTDYFPVKP